MSSLVKPWLVLAIIFIVGVVTGSALTIGLGSRFMHPAGPQQMKRLWMTHLTERLNLTADQQAKIQPIVTDADVKIHSLQRDGAEHIAQIFKETDDQISVLLTPDQKAELQKMESEREKMFSGHLHPWGPPHDGMHHHDGPHDDTMPPPQPPPPPPSDAQTNAPPPVTPPQNP